MSEDKWEDTRNAVNYTAKNIFAILGMVFAFLCSPVGLILSIIGRNQSKQRGDVSSLKLANIGMILSIVFMAIEVIMVIVVIAVAANATNTVVEQVPNIPEFPQFPHMLIGQFR